ncbi:hypothetical protein ACFOQM_06420 [Paenibacillus sp. GCM10012307]|uniref:Uncharacterized protein n=1 Tax=Paenibacillus roseus TaxID=2798579 RepID=A0A934J3G7_9BACL|nr:hypothetical protein [Paenibacillus roseus]MBJ6360934.1 hypothetical protein [Paenibacillus roseus]
MILQYTVLLSLSRELFQLSISEYIEMSQQVKAKKAGVNENQQISTAVNKK